MPEIARLATTDPDFDARLKALTAFDTTFDQKVEDDVVAILAGVRARGDAAVLEYTERFDRVKVARVADLELSRRELEKARAGLKRGEREALEQAAVRIRKYHERQAAKSWQFTEADGTTLGQRVTPLERVGMYVPGGLAAYPSSVLMNAIPARIAGVRELIMCVPTPNGKSNPLVLAAAAVAKVDRLFTIGGAQAIAALAYGTQTIPQVDKIVGPGNAWVVAAKRHVFGMVGIDMISGPTEILVICDGETAPDWIAMDLFSQAEHHETSQAILVSPDKAFLERVDESIGRLLAGMPRAEIIEKSLARRGALIKVKNLGEACDIANRIAPEHLELSVAEPKKWLKRIRHAGAIFLGRYSSEALGDYCAGPNHVLPTSRTARFSSPLGVYDFQKRSSIIDVSRKGAQKLGRLAMTLANSEGFQAHARSAEFRLGKALKEKP
ncbi:MAG: histidinol dehydrogenase [Betaproteobacteria bacterium]|jgi:histidinol dehydrogenase|nr:MAG: histidinol dehydrogenase [Betaproteobacteria bacterium]TMH78467.1 MAG: histidinol dehydrogenase [Betaproteobacteria bacterium]